LLVTPGGFLHARKDHPAIGVRRLFLRPYIPVAKLRVRILARLFEPGMLVRRMVHHQIDEHTDATLLGGVRELDKVTDRAVAWIDTVIVGYVISIIAVRRDLKRHQPDRCNSESMEIVQPAHQASKVTYAVPVGVHEGSNR